MPAPALAASAGVGASAGAGGDADADASAGASAGAGADAGISAGSSASVVFGSCMRCLLQRCFWTCSDACGSLWTLLMRRNVFRDLCPLPENVRQFENFKFVFADI